ncbi:MAG TPA: phosphopantothenoylcysteine decarboxylase, partial [Gammaproteobacteria bacterium]|nr:phosphopantothenoylcysteine decarboxylase [Gammaproteobacteria bacterium]
QNRPTKNKIIQVTTAQEMYAAVEQHIVGIDIFIGVAAVADYFCRNPAAQKIHKQGELLTIQLERTPDIISEVAKRVNKPFIIGFAAETENVVENATAKRLRKGMDVIIANQVGNGLAFEQDENAVTLISAEGSEEFALTTKNKLARQLVERIAALYKVKMANVVKIA